MSQYHDGRYYYQSQDQQQFQQSSQAPYPVPYQQLDEFGNPLHQQVPGGANETSERAYPPYVGRVQSSIASQQQNELFMSSQPPAPPPRSNSISYSAAQAPRYQPYNQPPPPPPPPPPAQQQSYNPQFFARPLSVIAGPAQQGVLSPSLASPPLPYNPADYQPTNVQRANSHRSSYSPGSYGIGSPAYSPGSQHTPTFTSPMIPQQPFSSSRASLYGPPRHSIPSATSNFGTDYTAPPPPQPPPRSQYPSSLSTIPQSATEPEDGWNHIPMQPPPPPPPSQSQLGYASYQRPTSEIVTSNSYTSPLSGNHRASLSYSSRHGSNGNVEPPVSSYAAFSHPLPPTPTTAATAAAPNPASRQHMHTASQSSIQPDDYFYSPEPEEAMRASAISADELLEQVEHQVRNFTLQGSSHSPQIQLEDPSMEEHSTAPVHGQGDQRTNGHLTNGHLSTDASYGEYTNESDLEADAGLEAMRMAEAEEAAEHARRESSGSGRPNLTPANNQRTAYAGDSDGNGGLPVDLGLFGGGFEAPHMSYGGPPEQLTVGRNSSFSRIEHRSLPASSTGSMRRSEASDAEAYEYDDNIHPFPPFANVRVDTGGTGGLEEPREHRRRLSYDEGDESGFFDEQGGIKDMYFHPGMSSQRPLPPLPASEALSHSSTPAATMPYPSEYGNDAQMPYARTSMYPQAPDNYVSAQNLNLNVPRSTSLLSHSTTKHEHPLRHSRTDAEEREMKWKQQQMRRSQILGTDTEISLTNTTNVALDLPSLPTTKRYNPAKLGGNDFRRCTEPWAISSIVTWLKSLADGEQDLRENMLVEGLIALFTNKVPTMNSTEAESLAERLVGEMRRSGVLVQEEEWLKFSNQTMNGVVYQLTGVGCYSSRLHSYNSSGRCYSHHCQRTLKKLDLSSPSTVKGSDDWASFYNLKPEDLEGYDKKEIDRQNILHEIIWKEDKFMEDLDVLRIIYRDALQRADPPLITPSRLQGFLKDVFSKADAVKKANEDHLLPQLKYRQREQGPWLVGFSDIFREWIRKARSAYIAYASAFPQANYRIRKEAERNLMFRTWLEKNRSLPQSRKLGWDTYLKVPITKLQQYGLLLDTVLRRSVIDSDEKRNLQIALEEIKAVTFECDHRVAEMTRKVDLKDLQTKLKLRPGMEQVELNLDHLGRELIFKGELQRKGERSLNWMETHVLLFDHYLVMAKKGFERDSHEGNVTREVFDVSRMPIPMDLLVLESRDDEAVVQRIKGLATVTVASKAGTSAAENANRLTRAGSSLTGPPTPGSLQHTNTSTSLTSLSTMNSGKTTVTTTILDAQNKDDKVMYPFRVKHLGKETYILYAPSYENREAWCDYIIEAKTRHAAALFAQNEEPFRVRILADAAFAYETGSGPSSAGRSTLIRGTPLDRSIEDVENRYRSSGRPNPVCRARVNCATNFHLSDGREMCAVGTEFGVFVSGVDDPRGWTRVITSIKVTQVAVLEDFSLFLLISDKALIAYHLDVVISGMTGGGGGTGNSVRSAPQKLSGSRDVGFFATGRMNDRLLVMYKKRDGLSSVFKVLEPVLQKSTEKRSRIPSFRSGRTEFFREYDEFYIPADCMGINLFHTSLAVSSNKGLEILTLEKKQTYSVPDLKPAHVSSIASRLSNQMPLGMFKLSDLEFLCVYEECAVYVDKHGDINRSVVMEFVGRARAAAVFGPYVLLFDSEMVEIRNAQNGRLRQVISGKDVRCIDDGQNGGQASRNVNRKIKIAMQHPRSERNQLVAELVLNEGLRE